MKSSPSNSGDHWPRRRPDPAVRLLQAAIVLALAGVGATLRAEITLFPLFGDHMVLQHDKTVPVWGWADPGERVTVDFRGQSAVATADTDGRWQVRLSPLAISTQVADLVVTGKNRLTVRDVVVGDVWLCSGQSNMEFALKRAANAEPEIAAAGYPQIRQFKMAPHVAGAPVDQVAGGWEACSPATAGDFTAVGYFFARDLQAHLGVPIGLINSTVGGTLLQAWVDPATLAARPAGRAELERWAKMMAEYPKEKARYDEAVAVWKRETGAGAAAGNPSRRKPRAPIGPGFRNTPSGLYDGMIAPLAPAALRGILWYQGEGNVQQPKTALMSASRGAAIYRELFPAMIAGWRAHFGQSDLPFYWVQLPNFDNSGAGHRERAALREAQASALRLPATGQAITFDIGEAGTNHPPNKQEVGRRLALIARVRLFDSGDECTGPVFAGVTTEGAGLRVRFTHAAGLNSRVSPPAAFEIAGRNREWHPAAVEIQGDSVIVSSPEVTKPVAVRYAWTNSPAGALYNAAGLPAAPFRTDDWPVEFK